MASTLSQTEDDLIAILSNSANIIKVYQYDAFSNSQVGNDIALGTGNWTDFALIEGYVAALDNTNNLIKVYDLDDNNAQHGSDISLGTGNWVALGMVDII